MSTDNNSGNSLWIVALSALLGFAAVYVTMGRHDNAAEWQVAVQSAANSAPEAKPVTKTGQMAAFVTKKVPAPLPEITFNDATGKTQPPCRGQRSITVGHEDLRGRDGCR